MPSMQFPACAGLLILAQLLFSRLVQADLPVHCLRHQVVGDWVFKVGPASEKRSACGHLRPDVEETQPSRKVVDSQSGDTQIAFTLKDPNVVEAAGGKKGTWTMVYDEGFEVNVDGTSYLAFSNFTFEKDAAHPKLTAHNVSHCGQTMVGWYRDAAATKFGCYYGYKLEKPQLASSQKTKAPATVAVHAMPKVAAAKENNTFDAPLDHKAQKSAVAKLNKKLAMLQLGWHAREVKKWNGKTMRQVNEYSGLRRTVRRKDMHRQLLQQQGARSQPTHARSFLQKAELPEAWDWGDINGMNYLEPVMDQADCGSCYAASSTRMLSARHKIKTNDTNALPWSITFPMMCSEYNQGCKGGFGFLLGKWSDDVGLLPATCMRYNTKGSCKLECDLKTLGKRYRAANHRYVGTYYGSPRSNEQMIMEEIYNNGPLALGMEPPEDFMYYSDGIFQSSSPKKKVYEEWEQMDHGVLAVGWGVENGTKYWRVQNSWGPDWGDDGFFRIRRGVDEASIESCAEAADVVEDEHKGKRVDELFKELDATKAAAVTKHSF